MHIVGVQLNITGFIEWKKYVSLLRKMWIYPDIDIYVTLDNLKKWFNMTKCFAHHSLYMQVLRVWVWSQVQTRDLQLLRWSLHVSLLGIYDVRFSQLWNRGILEFSWSLRGCLRSLAFIKISYCYYSFFLKFCSTFLFVFFWSFKSVL